MRRLIFVIAAVTSACGPVELTEPPQPRTAPPARIPELAIQERFLWIAFHHDDGTPRTLQRWEAPIRAAVFNPGPHLAAIEPHLQQISALTGLPASVVADPVPQLPEIEAPPQGYNLAIRMGRPEDLYPYAQEFSSRFGQLLPPPSQLGCFFFSDLRRPRSPKATIIIPSDLPTRLIEQCIVQETTQVLGLFGDLDALTDTAFTSWTGTNYLTIDDQQIVRLLYDERLEPGMTSIQAVVALGW